MAKDKERSVNPAQAQRRADKQKALKKGKAEVQARRNEKLARRNPDRLQRQINDLKALEESGQPLRPRDKQQLEELERDLRAVNKAREALGDRAPKFGDAARGDRSDRGRGHGVLGKRRRDGHGQWRQHDASSSGSDTDDSVRRIPMPRDTPPPVPRQYMQRRHGTNANMEPLGEGRGRGETHAAAATAATPQPKPEVKTVYEAAPVIKDLRKEAVRAFVPDVVRRKQESAKGQGRLVEPEEMDRLEKEGYVRAAQGEHSASPVATGAVSPSTNATPLNVSNPRSVQIEEVEDEDL